VKTVLRGAFLRMTAIFWTQSFCGLGMIMMYMDDSAGRLFIGVALTEEARRAIDAHLRRSMPDGVPGRSVPAANWHLTLRFLGAASADQLAVIARHLRAAELGPAFEIGFGGLGAFSRPRNARVLWIGLMDGVERMKALARIAEDAARAAGFEPEEKSFKPHLTLSRIQPPRDVMRAIAGVPPLDLRMPVREAVVFRSHLGGGPARYEAVERFALDG
jgi:2'-5' RNA ligase